MKILFIDPKKRTPKRKKYMENNLFYSFYSRYAAFRRPLAFSILAALTPENYEISVVQDEINKIDFDEHYDLVALTTSTVLAYTAYEMTDEFRNRGVTVVIGGWHASALPSRCKATCR